MVKVSLHSSKSVMPEETSHEANTKGINNRRGRHEYLIRLVIVFQL
jgi:hypothetical protein